MRKSTNEYMAFNDSVELRIRVLAIGAISSHKMSSRVLVYPLPIAGHTIPVLHLAAAIASKDVEVVFITTDKMHSKTLQWIDQFPEFRKEMVEFVSISLGPEAEKELSGMQAVEQAMISVMQAAAEFERVLEQVMAKGQVACVVSDFLMDWTQDVAFKFGVPRAAFWTSSATFLLLVYNFPELESHGCVPLQAESANKLIPCIQGVPALRARELPVVFHKDRPEDPGHRGATASVKKQLAGANLIITNTFDELEQEAVDQLRRLTAGELFNMGPLLSSMNPEGPKQKAEVLEWLSSRKSKSVVYISFGSLASLDSVKQLKELALGLEASQQNFLWSLEPRVLQGWFKDFMEEFKARTSDRGLVVDWAPQFQVLEHEAVAGFFTHSGWNSILESIWNGVPMLCWPLMAEQNLNAKFVADIWAVGALLDSFHSESICKAVVRLVTDTELSRRVDRMKTRSRKAAERRDLAALVRTLAGP